MGSIPVAGAKARRTPWGVLLALNKQGIEGGAVVIKVVEIRMSFYYFVVVSACHGITKEKRAEILLKKIYGKYRVFITDCAIGY